MLDHGITSILYAANGYRIYLACVTEGLTVPLSLALMNNG